MASIFEYILYTAAVLWFVLTITAQFPFTVKKLSFLYRYDKIYFFPVWKLFSPNPINCDYILIYKDLIVDQNGETVETEIREFKLDYGFSIGNKGECALFKNLSQIGTAVSKSENEKLFLKNCPEYYKIKYLVSHYKKEGNILKRQFSCFKLRHDNDSKKLVFTSEINYKKWN